MDGDSIYWSGLPGIPKKVKWPVQVISWSEQSVVFCQADKAYFNVSRAQLVPFPNEIEVYKKKANAALKKKPATLKAFLGDIDWALEECKQQAKVGSPSKCTKMVSTHPQSIERVSDPSQSTEMVSDPSQSTEMVIDPSQSTEMVIDPSQSTEMVSTLKQPTEMVSTLKQPTEMVSSGGQPTEMVIDPSQSTEMVSTHPQPSEMVIDPSQSTEMVSTHPQPSEMVSDPSQSTEMVSDPSQSTEMVSDPSQSTEMVSSGGQPTEMVSTHTQSTEMVSDPSHSTEMVSDPSQSTEMVSTHPQPSEMVSDPSQSTEMVSDPSQSTEMVSDPSQSTEMVSDPSQSTEMASSGGQPTVMVIDPSQSTEMVIDPSQSTEMVSTHTQSTEMVSDPSHSTEMVSDPSQSTEMVSTHPQPSEMVSDPSQSTELVSDPSQSTEMVSTHTQSTEMVSDPSHTTEMVSDPSQSTEMVSTHPQPSEMVSDPSQSTEMVSDPSQSTEMVSSGGQPTEMVSTHTQSTEMVSDPSHSTEMVSDPSQSTEMVSTHPQPSEMVSDPSQSTEMVSDPSQSTEMVSDPSQSTEMVSDPSQSTEMASSGGQPTVMVIDPSQSTEMVIDPSQSTEMVSTHTQSTEMVSDPSHSTEMVSDPSQSTEMVSTHPQPSEMVSDPSQSTELVSDPSQSTEMVSTHTQSTEMVSDPSHTTEMVSDPSQSTEMVSTHPQPSEMVSDPSQSTEMVSDPSQSTEMVSTHTQPTEMVSTHPQSTEMVSDPSHSTEMVSDPSHSTEMVSDPSQSTEMVSTHTQPTEMVSTLTQPTEMVSSGGQPTEMVCDSSLSTEIVSTHQQPTELVSDPPSQSTEMVSDPLQPTETVSDPLQPTEMISTHLQPAEMVSTHPQSTEMVSTHPQPAEMASTRRQSTELVSGPSQSTDTFSTHSQPTEMVSSPSQSAEMVSTLPQSTKMISNHPQSTDCLIVIDSCESDDESCVYPYLERECLEEAVGVAQSTADESSNSDQENCRKKKRYPSGAENYKKVSDRKYLRNFKKPPRDSFYNTGTTDESSDSDQSCRKKRRSSSSAEYYSDSSTDSKDRGYLKNCKQRPRHSIEETRTYKECSDRDEESFGKKRKCSSGADYYDRSKQSRPQFDQENCRKKKRYPSGAENYKKVSGRKYLRNFKKPPRDSFDNTGTTDESSDSDQSCRKKRSSSSAEYYSDSSTDSKDRGYLKNCKQRPRHSIEETRTYKECSDRDEESFGKKRKCSSGAEYYDRSKQSRPPFDQAKSSCESYNNDQEHSRKKRCSASADVYGRNSDSRLDHIKKQRDVTNSKIYVRKLLSSSFNSVGEKKKTDRIWNQVHACKFCLREGKEKYIKTNISKHLRNHKKESEIKDVVSASRKHGPKSKLVRAKWDLIRNLGDHENNLKVLEKQKGEIVLGRRVKGVLNISDYGPCPDCFTWMKINGSTMGKHQNTCPARVLNPTDKKGRKVLRILSLQLTGKISPIASSGLRDEVYTIMTNDDISTVAQSDPLIVSLGNLWLLKNIGNRLKRKYYTSSHMRSAARLLINLQNVTGLNQGFNLHLSPKFYDDIVKATLMTASIGFDDEEDLRSPSTALKMGYDLKRLIGAKWGIALRCNDEVSAKECKDLLKLMKFEWSSKVTKLATTTLQTRRYNKEQSLPEPDDLFKLQAFIKDEIKKLDLSNSSFRNYREAEVLAQTRLLMYNKRRSGEVEVVSIKDYLRRVTGVSNIDKAMRANLSDLELKLLETQDLMEVRGKLGRGVPIIVPSDAKPVLEYLINAEVRSQSGVQPSNKYLFPNTSISVVRAYDSLKSLCKRVDLKKPQKITSVTLRKYTATLSQVYDLSPQQQTWLTNHLGHTMDVHKIYYRQTSAVIERVDIAKMMLLQEYNLTSKFAGKKLVDIQIPGLVFGEQELNEQMIGDEEGSDEQQVHVAGDEPATFLEDEMDDPEYQPDLMQKDVHDDYEFNDDEEDDCDMGEQRKKRMPCTRVKWTPAEELEIKEYFKDNFVTKSTPGRRECENAIKTSSEKNGLLYRRNWETLKKKVWNMIKKLVK